MISYLEKDYVAAGASLLGTVPFAGLKRAPDPIPAAKPQQVNPDVAVSPPNPAVETPAVPKMESTVPPVAPVNPAVSEVAGQVTRPGQDIASIINTISRLEEGQARNIQTVRNIIRDHAKPSDFSGVALERAGGKIPKSGGEFWNHIGEMRQSIKDLRANATRLRNSLKDPSHPPDVRVYVESQIRVADEMIARMEAALR